MTVFRLAGRVPGFHGPGYPHSSAVRDAIVSGSCGHAEAEVPGERSIVGLAMLSTLARITAGTGIEFHLDVSNGAVVLTA
jgi:hypothetical protein